MKIQLSFKITGFRKVKKAIKKAFKKLGIKKLGDITNAFSLEDITKFFENLGAEDSAEHREMTADEFLKMFK